LIKITSSCSLFFLWNAPKTANVRRISIYRILSQGVPQDVASLVLPSFSPDLTEFRRPFFSGCPLDDAWTFVRCFLVDDWNISLDIRPKCPLSCSLKEDYADGLSKQDIAQISVRPVFGRFSRSLRLCLLQPRRRRSGENVQKSPLRVLRLLY